MVGPKNIHRHDSGLTLVELVLASFFGVIILASMYQLVFVARKGLEISQDRALMANEVGVPLDIADRYLAQTIKIVSASDYSCIIEVPPVSPESNSYNVKFEANEAGEFLMVRGNEPALVLSKHNANLPAGPHLFRYYDIHESEEDNKPKSKRVYGDEAEENADYLIITIAAQRGTSQVLESNRLVYLRNVEQKNDEQE